MNERESTTLAAVSLITLILVICMIIGGCRLWVVENKVETIEDRLLPPAMTTVQTITETRKPLPETPPVVK